MRYLSREEMEALDRRAQMEFGIPVETLMENAGRAVALEVIARTTGPIIVVCGKGNNGGDGFVAARYLGPTGRHVFVHVLAEPDPGTPAWKNYERVRPICGEFEQGNVLIDAIFGTGLARPVAGVFRQTIESINRRKKAGVFVVSVDIPSGLDANTGQPLGVAVEADLTVTMGCAKVGFQGAERYTGEVVVADIGYPPQLLA